ncbi:hypothetical protein EDD21DRAFT_356670 [Dissophora ornata]|nr:hypothetical protein EDD21DRAFT_356670 [Dissophora ornata]
MSPLQLRMTTRTYRLRFADFADAKKLRATSELTEVFGTTPLKGTIHVIVQRTSKGLNPEVAALRKQLVELEQLHAEAVDSAAISNVNTATVDGLLKILVREYPQYANDNSLEVFVLYMGFSYSQGRSVAQCTQDLEALYSWAWLDSYTKSQKKKVRDVVEEYKLSYITDPSLECLLPLFTEIEAAPLEPDSHTDSWNYLCKEIEARTETLLLIGSNESTRSMVVASFLVWATKLFRNDLYLGSQRYLSGKRGNGPVDFSISRNNMDHCLGVTEVKKEDFRRCSWNQL